LKALNYALKLLKFRSRSENEIRKRLKLKGFNNNEIEDVIKKLKEYNYLNDFESALNFVKLKCNKGWSRKKIYIGLKKRLYSNDIIKSVLDYYDETAVIEKLRKELKRKQLSREEVIKLLKSRGFENHIISKVLNYFK